VAEWTLTWTWGTWAGDCRECERERKGNNEWVFTVLAGHGIVGDAAGWTREWWEAERLGKVMEGCLLRRELGVLVTKGTVSRQFIKF